MDVSTTLTANSDQINACDLFGGPITVKVKSVNLGGSKDQPMSLYLEGDRQPFKPCLSMRRILVKLWGKESDTWIGKSMTLYCDESVMWAGERAGGIRISHMQGLPSPQDVIVRASSHSVTKYTVLPLIIDLPPYLDEDINVNKDNWRTYFAEGKKPDDLINSIQQKFTLTEKQISSIKQLAEAA